MITRASMPWMTLHVCITRKGGRRILHRHRVDEIDTSPDKSAASAVAGFWIGRERSARVMLCSDRRPTSPRLAQAQCASPAARLVIAESACAVGIERGIVAACPCWGAPHRWPSPSRLSMIIQLAILSGKIGFGRGRYDVDRDNHLTYDDLGYWREPAACVRASSLRGALIRK